MSYDRAQLVTQALIELNVIAEGQSVSDSDMAKMDGYVNGAMSELNGLEIFYVADFGELGPTGGNFDDAAFLSLAKYLANAATAGFNQAADEKMKALEIEAIARAANALEASACKGSTEHRPRIARPPQPILQVPQQWLSG